jgi:hypothetical protein
MALLEDEDFGVDFKEVNETWDPLADFEDEEEDESEGQLGPHVEAQGQLRHSSYKSDEPASVRINHLFERLKTRRRVMLGILAFVDEPRRSDAVQVKVDELQRYDKSVYTGYDFTMMFEEAGAIVRVEEDGSPFDETIEQVPDIIEVDGIKFYKPTDGKQVFWLITEEGQNYLDSDDPSVQLENLLQGTEPYQPLYARVLEVCAQENGQTTSYLANMLDNNPLSQNPRRYSSFFTKGLEDVGALVWEGSWKTTELGKRALEKLTSEEASHGNN